MFVLISQLIHDRSMCATDPTPPLQLVSGHFTFSDLTHRALNEQAFPFVGTRLTMTVEGFRVSKELLL